VPSDLLDSPASPDGDESGHEPKPSVSSSPSPSPSPSPAPESMQASSSTEAVSDPEQSTLVEPELLADEAMVRKIRELPREVGVMLLSVGTLGIVMPGIMGTPALIAGGLVLWPEAFGRVENWFERRYPQLHHQSMKQIGRYLDDLEKRYPSNE
jgi:hypothetical protein